MTMRYPWEPPPCANGHVFTWYTADSYTPAPAGIRCQCGLTEWRTPATTEERQ